jgi:hypothetical protein
VCDNDELTKRVREVACALQALFLAPTPSQDNMEQMRKFCRALGAALENLPHEARGRLVSETADMFPSLDASSDNSLFERVCRVVFGKVERFFELNHEQALLVEREMCSDMGFPDSASNVPSHTQCVALHAVIDFASSKAYRQKKEVKSALYGRRTAWNFLDMFPDMTRLLMDI